MTKSIQDAIFFIIFFFANFGNDRLLCPACRPPICGCSNATARTRCQSLRCRVFLRMNSLVLYCLYCVTSQKKENDCFTIPLLILFHMHCLIFVILSTGPALLCARAATLCGLRARARRGRAAPRERLLGHQRRAADRAAERRGRRGGSWRRAGIVFCNVIRHCKHGGCVFFRALLIFDTLESSTTSI